ncbi:MAG: Hsp20/alpha crystallin family protein [Pirellulales bacterium]
MASRRFSQPNSFGQLRSEVERLLGDFSRQTPLAGWVPGAPFPAVNIWETDQDVFVEAEIPGVKESDLEILVVGEELTIKGKRGDVSDDTSFHRRERGVGPFSRVVRLPVEVDADKVEAALREGVLEIRLAKAAASRPRKIRVNVT